MDCVFVMLRIFSESKLFWVFIYDLNCFGFESCYSHLYLDWIDGKMFALEIFRNAGKTIWIVEGGWWFFRKMSVMLGKYFWCSRIILPWSLLLRKLDCFWKLRWRFDERHFGNKHLHLPIRLVDALVSSQLYIDSNACLVDDPVSS